MRKIQALSIALIALLICGFSTAKRLSPAAVDQVLSKYRGAGAIQAKLKKTVAQEYMGTSSKSEGRFYFSKGKLRMDIDKPDKSVLVYDGKSIWLESRLDDTHVQVSHLRSNEMKRTDSLMAALFDRKDVLKQFNLLKVATVDGQKVYTFEPKDKAKTEVRALEVALKDDDLSRVTYKDQMENEVTFEFSDIKQATVSVDKFAYKPPKDASVTEM